MKKRTLIHCLPAAAAAAGNLLLAAPKQGLNRVKRGLDLKGTQPVYTAVLTADLHTDADPCRDRRDVLRLAFSGFTRIVARPDVFVIPGDITNCGDEKEYRSVCDEIAVRHRGRLDVANAPEGGCLVTLVLPLK